MVPFAVMFPEVAKRETRSVIVMPPEDGRGGGSELAGDEYAMFEQYCDEVDCDCRRVVIQVASRYGQRIEATINHAFDAPGTTPGWKADMPQTFLDPINPQGEFAEDVLDLFVSTVLTPEYEARLRRHYAMVKRAIADPTDPVHARIAEVDTRRRPPRRGNPADLMVPRKRRKWR